MAAKFPGSPPNIGLQIAETSHEHEIRMLVWSLDRNSSALLPLFIYLLFSAVFVCSFQNPEKINYSPSLYMMKREYNRRARHYPCDEGVNPVHKLVRAPLMDW